jgi:hypothetical protein
MIDKAEIEKLVARIVTRQDEIISLLQAQIVNQKESIKMASENIRILKMVVTAELPTLDFEEHEVC